jgi:cell division protein FtsN
MYKDFKKSESLDTGFVGGSGLLWMFSGIVLGLLFGLGMYYFSNEKTPRISIVDSLQKKIEKAQSSKTIPVQRVSSNSNVKQNRLLNSIEQKKPREHTFSYYAVLPTLDVPVGSSRPIDTRKSPKPDVATAQVSNTPVTKSVNNEVTAEDSNKEQIKAKSLGDYLLQVASFKKESMADKTRGRLTNKGIDAYVQKKKIKGRFWYRVVAGPVDQYSVDNWKHTAEQLGHRPLVISVR